MFKARADEVRNQLKDMVSSVEETLADKTDEVFMQIKRDYRAVLGTGEAPQGEVIPRVQRLVRKEIKKTIEGAERMINVVLGYEIEDLPDLVEDAEDATTGKQERDSASNGVKAEDKEFPDLASISTEVKHEAAEAAAALPQPSADSTSPCPEGSESAGAGVKDEDEENTGSANGNDSNNGSDAADDSEAEEAKDESGSGDD
ncbi:MAG: hypothetical protein Q9199_000641 [Rusavskia elegans]